MMVEPLPNELVGCILEYLYSDKATLKSCALVGKAWVPTSQRGIFEKITLFGIQDDSRVAPPRNALDAPLPWDALEQILGLVSTFNAKPHLASYVRSLELREFGHTTNTLEDFRDSMVEIIQRLTKVNKLLLTTINWKELSDPLRTVLCGAFKLPSLTEITMHMFSIDRFANLGSLLSHATCLKVLDIRSLSCGGYTSPDAPSSDQARVINPRSIKLDELRTNMIVATVFSSWSQKASCPFEIRHLRTLGISAIWIDPVASSVVQRAGSSLTKLELSYQNATMRHSPGHILDLRQIPNLLSFTLGTGSRASTEQIIRWIQGFFEPVLDLDQYYVHPLRHFTLVISVDPSDSLWMSKCDKYAVLDVLFGKATFASLETVRIVLDGKGQEVPSRFGELLRGKLPCLDWSEQLMIDRV